MNSPAEASGGGSGSRSDVLEGATLADRACWAVVVNWNGGDANLRCLDSLLAAGLPLERVVFVDNASSDGSLEAVEARASGLLVLRNAENLGFGEGANQGARAALERGASSVFFVNNDLRVEEASLRTLLDALAAEPALGIAGPRVLFDDGSDRIWCAGGRLDHRQNLSTLLGHGEPDGPRWRRTFDVDYVAGCAMLVSREVFERVGFLRADYFAYMEDVEFCLRARRAGFAVRTLGESVSWHAPSSATGGGYSPRRKYMQGVNSIRFLREYGGVREWWRLCWFDVASLLPLLVVAPLRGRTRGVLAKALGLWDGLRGRRVEGARLRPGGSWLW